VESSFAEKDLVDTKLNVSQQCALATKNVKNILSSIRQSITIRLRDVILPLYSSLVWPHLDHCVQFWASWYKPDWTYWKESNKGLQR